MPDNKPKANLAGLVSISGADCISEWSPPLKGSPPPEPLPEWLGVFVGLAGVMPEPPLALPLGTAKPAELLDPEELPVPPAFFALPERPVTVVLLVLMCWPNELMPDKLCGSPEAREATNIPLSWRMATLLVGRATKGLKPARKPLK